MMHDAYYQKIVYIAIQKNILYMMHDICLKSSNVSHLHLKMVLTTAVFLVYLYNYFRENFTYIRLGLSR